MGFFTDWVWIEIKAKYDYYEWESHSPSGSWKSQGSLNLTITDKFIYFPTISPFTATSVSLSLPSTWDPLSLSFEGPLLNSKLSGASSQLLSNSLRLPCWSLHAKKQRCNYLIISGNSGALQINLWAYPCWPENSFQCTFGHDDSDTIIQWWFYLERLQKMVVAKNGQVRFLFPFSLWNLSIIICRTLSLF